MGTRRLGALLLGAALLSMVSAAHAAPFAYITQSSSNSVAVIDTANNAVVTTILGGEQDWNGIGFTPFGVAVHPSGSHVYVGNTDSNTVSVIATASNTVVGTVSVGTDVGPAGLAIHPNGSRLYVANQFFDSVTVIDTASLAVVGTVTVGGEPVGVAVNPAGTRLYVTNNGSNTVSVVDTATLTVVATVPVGQRPIGVAVNPSGTRVYVTNVMGHRDASNVLRPTLSVLDASTNTTITTVQVGSSPRGVAVHPSGSHVYVANGFSGTVSVIETAGNTVVATPTLGVGLYGIGVTPSGSHVYVASQGQMGVGQGVYVLATSNLAVSGPLPLTGQPTAFGLFMTPAASSCDTTALEQALTAARQQVTALQASNQTRIADNARLRTELASIRVTIASFVDRLFGERTDSNVALTVRAAALSELGAARASSPRDWRLRLAQNAFDHGEQAMRRRDWNHAVHSFRAVHVLLDRLLRDRPSLYGSPVPAPAGPSTPALPVTPVSDGGCDTSALEQALAAAKQQIASLQTIGQALGKESGQLQVDLNTARSTVESFVDRLFGDRSDGNVAAAAQAAALAKLNAAKSSKPADKRLKSAQQSLDTGQWAMRRHDWGRAVHEFREVHEVAERILDDHKKHAYHHGR
jgi:YVTN family beta-propeller protein